MDAANSKKAKTLAKGASPISGVVPPKDKRFGQPNGNPRGRGFWDITATPRYKLEQMFKLTADELKKVATDDKAPLFERKLAQCVAKGNWKEIEAMINQVYGQPKQVQETKLEAEVSGIDVTFRDESRANK